MLPIMTVTANLMNELQLTVYFLGAVPHGIYPNIWLGKMAIILARLVCICKSNPGQFCPQQLFQTLFTRSGSLLDLTPFASKFTEKAKVLRSCLASQPQAGPQAFSPSPPSLQPRWSSSTLFWAGPPLRL